MAQRGRRRQKEKTARKPLWIAIIFIVAWLGIGGTTGPLFGKLTSVQENDSSGFLPSSAESTKAGELAAKFIDRDADVLPALVIFTGDVNETAIGNLTNFVQTLPGVAVPESGGRTLGDFIAADGQIFPIPAQDGKAAIVSVPFDDSVLASPLENNEPALPVVVEALREHAKTVPGFESHVTGIGGILADLFDSFGSIDTSLLRTTLIVVAIILIFVYRSPFLWIIPLVSAVWALAVGGGVVYLLAKNDIIKLDGQSQGILSVLVIGAATDYALLLIARYREELHHYESTFVAMRVALKGVFEPILASGLTVISGLLVLSLSDLAQVRGLGPVSAIGILAAQLVMLTLLPAILVIFGRWIFWPRIPRHDDVDEKLTGLWSKVANLVGTHPRRTWITTTVLLFAAVAFVPQLKISGLSQTDSFTGNPDSVVGLEKLAEHFPAGQGDPTLIIIPMADLAKVTSALNGVQGVSSVSPTLTGPVIVGAPAPEIKVVENLVRLEVILDQAADSVEAQKYVPDLRAVVKQASPEALVGGSSAINYDLQQANARDRNLIIPVALVVIGIILALLLRSLFAPLLLIATTVLSFGATLGISHLVFTHIFGFKGADGSFPLFAFVFLVALGIDYNIFLMTRVREEAIKLGTRAGILKGLTVTGGVITSAGVVLAATFAVLGTLPLVFLVELGFAVAFGVLLDTIVVRSLLVPALAHDIGAKIWWPSKLGKTEEPLLISK
jgi:RND superfamily putative drug exporter